MRLQQEQEKSEQWRSDKSQEEAKENQQDLTQTSTSVLNRITYSDRTGMIKAIANIVAIRLVLLFGFAPAVVDLLKYFYTGVNRDIPGWFSVATFAWNVGVIILIGWIVAVIAPRRIVPTIAYASAISYLITLAHFLFLYRQGGVITQMLPSALAEGTVWAITSAVTEIIIATFFVRRFTRAEVMSRLR